MPGVADLDARALEADAVDLLRRLIRIDTVNPPGRERPAQTLLAERLTAAGFECELLGATEERPNLVARLRGAADGPTLCLLGHTDTVLADASAWSRDPFSGDLADGFIWGRGAIDMKSQVAAEVAAAVALAGAGWRPAHGELSIVAVVDEETGGELGARWLTAEHPEKVRCQMLLNEGAGACFEYGGRRRYGVSVAEKGVFRFSLTTRGAAAHASTPRMGENALLKMAPLLSRLAAHSPSPAMTPQARALLAALGEDPEDSAGALARIAAHSPALHRLLEPVLSVSMAPTRISASQKINVIPSECELRVDCRVPPGLGEDDVRAAIEEVLGSAADGDFELAFTERIPGNSSPASSPLMEAIETWVAEHDPGAGTVATVMPGFTDSRHFREAFPDCVAYGFFPQRHQSLLEAWPLMHGADERIDVRDLHLAAGCYADLAVRLLG